MAKKRQDKFGERSTASYQRTVRSIPTREPGREPFIVLSFRFFDRNQGQGFEEWEADALLALAVRKLAALSQLTVKQALAEQLLKQYTKVAFPPSSGFYYPRHVPEGVTWCSMHIQGKECVIGFFEEHVFQVVFLDRHHEFWKTEKKNT